MLSKYLQNCMYSFRENWEINIRIFHSVPLFNPQLLTISLKSKVLFQRFSKITWSTVYASMTWFPFVWWWKVNKTDSSTKDLILLDWLIFLLYLLQFVCCSKYSAKTSNFLFWNLFLLFLHPARPETFQNVCYCKAI